jgi:hypothetical protein
MDKKSKTWREIIVFLVLTAILSTLAYIPIIQAGTTGGGPSKLAGLLMLAPGLAAVITYLVFERSLRPVGWRHLAPAGGVRCGDRRHGITAHHPLLEPANPTA